MKRIFGWLLTTITVLGLSGCSISSVDPVAYNDSIIDILDQVDEVYDSYSTYAEETSISYVDNIEKKRTDTLITLNGYTTQLTGIGPLGDDSTLINAATTYVATIISLMEHEDKDLVALWKQANDNPDFDETSYQTQQTALIDAIVNKIEAANNTFETIQTSFATTQGYELIENDEPSVIAE